MVPSATSRWSRSRYVGAHQSLRGSVTLPESFTPRQTTINVLDRVGGKSLGMRVLYVQQ